ncbi:hypothetical protein [uncultured Nocardioides sp.]|uniref:hypothetical protein n=1 Tax=uncultured Nocardioides sp. TaxID=198441 RepID=UPI002605C06F|nr:hypothetical protein [uncultured Nocardioides sp.]
MSSLLDVPLPRRMHRLPVVRLVHGGAAERAWSWDLRDQWTREWWPQGITWAGERLLVSWYSRRGGGSRVSVVDLVARRYAHVPLLTPDGEPLRVHAGGLAWDDGWLYVAATTRGFWTLHVDDLAFTAGRAARSASDERRRDPATWPARRLHRPVIAGSDQPFRWSFMDLAPPGWSTSEERRPPSPVEVRAERALPPVEVRAERASRPLLAGEYGRGGKSTRLARLAISNGQLVGDLHVLGEGPAGMQGVTTYADGLVVSTSAGPWRRGSLHRLALGRTAHAVGDARATRAGATPVGVEDLTRPDAWSIWTAAEHPGRRAVIQLCE